MSNPLDTDAGSELFSSYETELKLVQADLNQKLDQIAESSGEQRKSAIRQAERALDEATELVCWTHLARSAPRVNFPLTGGNTARSNAHGEAEHPLSSTIENQHARSQLRY